MLEAAGEPTDWTHLWVTALAGSLLWVPISIFALWLVLRVPIEEGNRARGIVMHVGAACGVSMFRALAVAGLNPMIGWYAELPPFRTVLLHSLPSSFLLYWMLVALCHLVHYAGRLREHDRAAASLRAELIEAQLIAFKSQLQPNFLLTTLSTLGRLVTADADAADRMIDKLSRLLRHTLEHDHQKWIAIADELEFLRLYIDIEVMRFGDRISVTWDVEEAATRARVPQLILQPLVENVFRHALGPKAGRGTLAISVKRSGASLVIRIEDDGMGMPVTVLARGSSTTGGRGLADVRARLSHLYQDRHVFGVRSAPRHGTAITMTVPYLENEFSGVYEDTVSTEEMPPVAGTQPGPTPKASTGAEEGRKEEVSKDKGRKEEASEEEASKEEDPKEGEGERAERA